MRKCLIVFVAIVTVINLNLGDSCTSILDKWVKYWVFVNLLVYFYICISEWSCACIFLWVHFFFVIFSCSFCKFKNSICEYYTFYNLYREILCEGLKRVWFLCAVVPRRNLLIQVSSREVNLRNKTVCNIISIFLELLGFDDLIGFKSDGEKECHDIDEPSLWYGRRIGFKDDWICREDSLHESWL